MKNLFRITLSAVLLLLGAASCTDNFYEISEEIAFSRCLTPTDLTARVDDGQYVGFSWTKTRGADSFVLEVYSDEAMTTPAHEPVTVSADDYFPVTLYFAPDLSLYARVKACDSTGAKEDSHWAVWSAAITTYAIKDGLNPELVSRTGTSITIKWTQDPDVDHIRISPAANPDDEYTRFDLNPAAVEAGQVEVTGLNGSTYYTLTVHYASADRGSVSAWTMPDASLAVAIADTAQFKQLIKDGAAMIAVPYADSVYSIGNVEVVKPLTIMGIPNEEGKMPTVVGGFKLNENATLLSLQGLRLDGKEYQYGHVITLNKAIEGLSVDILNCEMTAYTKGLYYDNFNSKVTSLLVDGTLFTDFRAKDGDFIDIRQTSEYGVIKVQNSTFATGQRDFFRIDANAKVGTVLLDHCTVSDWARTGTNNGIFYVRGTVTDFKCSNNIFLNENGVEKNCIVRQATYKVPVMEGNWFFNCGGTDDYFLKNIYAQQADETAKKALADGILATDPCQDSGLGQFNLVNEKLISLKAGDPRWLEEFIEIPEDLTQEVTVPVKTWDLKDNSVFYKSASKDMVRDGIRFYITGNPVVFEADGFLFTAPATLESGAPVDCGLGFKVNGPGSVVLSTGTAGDGTGMAVVSLDGKPALGIPAGSSSTKVVFDAIASEQTVYVYAVGGPVKLTALQWSDDIDTGASKVLGTPVPQVDIASVNEGEDKTVTVSWDAVAKAGSYAITLNGADKGSVTTTSYAIATKSFEPGTYTVGVKALPAATDLISEASEETTVSFTVKPVLKTLTAETVWDAAYFEALSTKYGTDAVKDDFVEGNLGYVNGTGSGFKFAQSEIAGGVKVYRAQLAGTGAISGGTVTKCGMQIKVGGNGTLEIHTLSSSNTDDRVLKVNDTTVTATKAKSGDVFVDPTVHIIPVKATEGTLVNWCSNGSGINIFYVKWTPEAGSVPEPPATNPNDHVWDFSTSAWQDAFSALDLQIAGGDASKKVGPGKDLTGDWDITIDGLNFYCKGDKNRYTDTALQTGGTGSKTKRVLTFTTTVTGTLTVVSSNTGKDPASPARNVAVCVDDDTPVTKSGGAGSATPDTNTFEISKAGKVYIYGPDGALRFYKIEFKAD